MINVLIMSKQINICKEILNKSINQIEELKVIGIVTDLSEANFIMKNIEPDLIITTELSIINILKSRFTTYSPSIVIISNIKNTNINYNNVLLLNSDLKYSQLTFEINSFIKREITISSREKIIKTLINLKFDFNLSGTLYILDAALYVHSYKGSYTFENMKRDIYSYIAKIDGTNMDRVKWSISRSINYMYNKHTKESYKIIEEFFGTPYPSKPTPKLVISLIANKTKL